MEGRWGLLFGLVVAACFYGNAAQKTVCTQEAVADIVFLVDGSWSIGTTNFEQIRRFLYTLVNSFDVGPDHVRIGLVQYSTTPRTEFHLNAFENKDDILRNISSLPYKGGGTLTGLGLDFMLTEHFVDRAGSRANDNVPQIAVVITDGQSQDNVEPHAQELRKKGIILYAIGIKDADEEQLREIANQPHDQHVYSVSDFAALQGISQSIVQTLCTTVEEAKRQLTFRVKECASATKADIVFLVDGSSSIGLDNFQEIRQFLHTIVEGLDIGPDKVRVGLAQYSEDPRQEFLLKDHTDKRSLLEQVDKLPYKTGATSTGKAITFLQNHYFTKEAGSRADERVPQIAVVITDGESADDVAVPAQLLRKTGVILFAIGVGAFDENELKSIANRPHERFVFKIDNFQALQRLTDGLLQTVCTSMEDKRLALVQRYADIFFLVDSSLSSGDFQQTRNLLNRLVAQLNIGASAHRLGLAQFSRDANVEFLLNAYATKQETKAAVTRFRQRRGRPNEPRNLGLALQTASTNFFTSAAGGRQDQGFGQFLVVVSGGNASDPVIMASRSVKAQGVKVVGIALGSAPVREMRAVATAPYVWQATNIAPQLKALFETEDEAATITGDCNKAKLADVVFIIDESSSIGTANFQLMRTFVHNIVNGLDVGRKRVRVGIVMYNDRPTAQVYLDSFDDKSEILDFIKILPYRGGGTNTGAALKFATEKVFVEARGSRKSLGVQQVAIIITDGESQDNVTAAARDLRRAGVTVYCLGIQNANKNELVEMATYPPRRYVFIVDSFTKLKPMVQSMQKILCTDIFDNAITINTRRSTIKEGCVKTEEADIFFLIDHSGSIHPQDFTDMKKFIIEFVHPLRIGPEFVRVGVAKYADTPNLEFDLTTYTDIQSLEKGIENIEQIGGGTQTGDALSFMTDLFDRAAVTRGHQAAEYLIVITDGKSADEVKLPAEKLRAQGIIIYAIGVKSADKAELLEISGSPQKMFLVNNFDALRPLKDDIMTDICAQDACKDRPGDLIFLIDSSGSINPEDFQKMKDFMKSLISKSLVGRNEVHVGVMQYSISQELEFPLNSFFDKTAMSQAIEQMQQLGGGTLTGSAISDVIQYFDQRNGGRPDLGQRLIVITDGESQDEVKGPAEALRAKGVLVYAIGVVNANSTQLLEIAGTQDRVYSQRDFDALKDLESLLAMEICEPEADCKRTEVADMIFLVDGSTSITRPKFQSMIKFMESVVNETTVGMNQTRFGVILFATEPQMNFTLNQYYSKKQVSKAIASLHHPYGDTYTGKALAYSLQYFEAANGGRKALNVPQILFVITDGDATDPANLLAPSNALRDNGIKVFSIGVAEANKDQLEIMAGGDKSRVFYVNDFDALEVLYKNISHVLCPITKPVCEKQKADLVMLIDQSGSIASSDYTVMKEFMTGLVSSFQVSEEFVRVGVAQFSSSPQKEFYLNEFHNEAAVNERILSMIQQGGGTNIGEALRFIKDYFQASHGSRKLQGVSQNLVLITDGDSQDEVEAAAASLRAEGIEVFAIGIGDVHDLELLQITKSSERLFTVQNFGSLANIKQKVVDTICQSRLIPDRPACSIDIAFGFDMSYRPTTQPLVAGQPKLQTFLPEIVHYVSTLQGLCCVGPSPVSANIAYSAWDRNGKTLHDLHFAGYSDEVVKKVMAWQMSEPTYFNTDLLHHFRDKFSKESNAGVKVLVIFSDGLDEDVMKLERESELLRQSGISALLIVALEGARDARQLQMVEFGRGFGYKVPLSIGMQSVGSTMLKQVDTVADRECCNVMCKCSGSEGIRGFRGLAGSKGVVGPKGHPGYPGEEGIAGDRGLAGPFGPQGIQGCAGSRGMKGYRGHRGNRGEDGEHGLDGVNGEQGVTGLSGSLGERGNPGNPGIPGIRGAPGEPGQRGLRGDPGEPGVDNTVPGPKGDVGDPGQPGMPGDDGRPGETGVNGGPGPKGRRGPFGPKGPTGESGVLGDPGSQGPSGSQGARGVRGPPGLPGPSGLPGPQGGPGTAGRAGQAGRHGANGQKGQAGDPGLKGVPGTEGPRGMPGLDGRDGHGPAGRQGAKGEIGFPGYPGLKGEDGQQGLEGKPGPNGTRGRNGYAGHPGESGVSGDIGYPGHPGSRGPAGVRDKTECQLITYIRDNCACSHGQTACPAYPTELVFALDMSEDVTPDAFERSRAALLSLLEDMAIAESNCPTGARVAVVAYSTYTKYLIRFQDYRRKKQLIEAVQNIALERTANQRNLGAAMRFVGQNVFKRVRQGMRMRKVAVFFANGPSQHPSTIVTAVMEYRALNIVPAVIALKKSPNIRQALQVDDTGSSTFTLLERSDNLATDLQKTRNCAICYDPCRPVEDCASIQENPGPQIVDVDLAVMVDGSREILSDQFTGVQELLGSVVEQLAISPQPGKKDSQARVALVQQSGSLAATPTAKLEFDLQAYETHDQMKRHVVQDMQQQGGWSALGQTLEYTLREVLLKAPRPRKKRVLLAVVGSETSSSDRAKLKHVAQEAKCQGVAVFVVAVGEGYNRAQALELASPPVEQHLIHVSRLKAEEQGYTQRFFRTFLSALDRGMNVYPPASLKRTCDQLGQQGQGSVSGQGEANLEEFEEVETYEAHTGHRTQKGLTQLDVIKIFSRGDGDIHSQPELKALCQLDADIGIQCGDYVQRWFFDKAIGACSPFWYGGCGGNANSFSTEHECFQTCGTYTPSIMLNDPTYLLKTETSDLSKDVCFQREDVGSCQNYTMMWYFDQEQSECSRFWFGGCGGNGNRFETQAECENLCLIKRR